MSITATELKTNLGKYLLLAEKEKIFITQYGKVIAVLSNPTEDKLAQLEEMKAKFSPLTRDQEDDYRWERLSEKCGL